jgi:hypothetical protein
MFHVKLINYSLEEGEVEEKQEFWTHPPYGKK